MTRREAWLQHLGTTLVGVSGLIYGWMLFFAEPEDPFAVANHPWQHHFRAVHIVTAPLLVFGLGLIWRNHVWKRVVSGFRVRRKTGLLLFAAAWPMLISGYAVQVASDDLWHSFWSWTHLVTSVVWVLIYPIHQWAARSHAQASAPQH